MGCVGAAVLLYFVLFKAKPNRRRLTLLRSNCFDSLGGYVINPTYSLGLGAVLALTLSGQVSPAPAFFVVAPMALEDEQPNNTCACACVPHGVDEATTEVDPDFPYPSKYDQDVAASEGTGCRLFR